MRKYNKLKNLVKSNYFLTKETIKGCLNKTIYTSRYVAESEAKKFGMRSYKCSHCNMFHLTSLID